jgi:PAS domain S-box-containing protein
LVRVLDLVADAIVGIDEHQRVLIFSKGAEQMFGYRAVELLGQPVDRLLPGRFVEVHRRLVGDFARAPETVRWKAGRSEIVGRRKDGTEFPLAASIAKLRIDDRLLFTAVLHDLDDRKRAESQRLALELNDSIVQGLVLTQSTLALGGGVERGLELVSQTLATARRLVTELLGEGPVKPGDLVRSGPAGIPTRAPRAQ